MKSIKQQYIDLKEGRMSQHNFMRSVRMSLPQYITNVTSFNDTVKILKNKGILNEATIGIDPIESALKSYLAKGYSYSEAIRAVAAEEGIDEETLSFQYPQDRVDIEGYEADDDAELEDMIARAEEEESGKYTKNYDFPGGLSEKNLDVDPDQLKLGIKTEMEHTSDSKVAEEIALDHLSEDPHYYTKLKKAGLEEIKEAKEIKGSSGKEQYSKFGGDKNDNLEEVTTGINIEHECFPEKTYDEIEKIVLKNIKKNPNYYTDYKLTGIRDYKPQTMDASTPESHQMKFVKGEDSYVDKVRGMKPVKGVEKIKASSNKASKETNKVVKGVEELTHFAQTVRGLQKFATTGGKMKVIRLKEARFETMPGEEPNKTVQHASQFIDSNPVLRQISKEITLQNDGENAVLKYGYWEALPDEAYNKLELQFNVEDDFEAGDFTNNKISYILYPKQPSANVAPSNMTQKPSFRPGVDLGKSFDKFKSMLEEIVREVIAETFDGRDNLIDPIAAEEENN
jgi:hypothetical protein